MIFIVAIIGVTIITIIDKSNVIMIKGATNIIMIIETSNIKKKKGNEVFRQIL